MSRRMAVMILLAVTISSGVARAAQDDCSVVIGMSQVRNVFQGARTAGLDTTKWFLHWSPGLTLGSWADPSSVGWSSPKYETSGPTSLASTCQHPTHASFGFDPATKSGVTMHAALDAVLANIQNEYPTIQTADFWLFVGNDNHDRCLLNGRYVKAADAHRNSYSTWQSYVSAGLATLGPDLHVDCPGGWRDVKGHLSTTGSLVAGTAWLAHQTER